MADFSLGLYTSVLQDNAPRLDITKLVEASWSRSIRLQGGYWLGSFSLVDNLDILRDYFYTWLGYHIKEHAEGEQTWEGLVYEMDLNNDPLNPRLDVQTAGYALTLSWRYVSVADDADGNLSTWIADILTTDCEFVLTQSLTTNALQVRRATDIDMRAWDELSRVVAMGDASGNMYRLYFTNNRRVIYELVDTTPKYFARGGLIRRRSLDIMANHITGTYADTSDVVQTLAATSQADSIARYGRREEKLIENNVPQAAMEALRDTMLKEQAWPWGRVVASVGNVELFNTAGGNLAANPWTIKPGVARDVSYGISRSEPGSAFSDARDFLIEEVTATSYIRGDEQKSRLSFRALDYEESTMLEVRNEALARQRSMTGAGSAGGQRDTWRNFTPDHPKWGDLTEEEKAGTYWGVEHGS